MHLLIGTSEHLDENGHGVMVRCDFFLILESQVPHFLGNTLPETNIAQENPHLSRSSKWWIFHGYVSFQECSCWFKG